MPPHTPDAPQNAPEPQPEGFTLTRPPARNWVKWRPQVGPAKRQGKLFAGADCLPDQQQLFPSDGPRAQE